MKSGANHSLEGPHCCALIHPYPLVTLTLVRHLATYPRRCETNLRRSCGLLLWDLVVLQLCPGRLYHIWITRCLISVRGIEALRHKTLEHILCLPIPSPLMRPRTKAASATLYRRIVYRLHPQSRIGPAPSRRPHRRRLNHITTSLLWRFEHRTIGGVRGVKCE